MTAEVMLAPHPPGVYLWCDCGVGGLVRYCRDEIRLLQWNAKRQLMKTHIGLAFILMAIASTAAKSAEIAGKWESNKGPMTIAKEANGSFSVTFAPAAGKTNGTLDGNVFQGTWARNDAPERCKSEKEGSPYWGGFKVNFYTPEIFQGYWYGCTDELKDGMAVDNWTGARPK